MPPTSEEAGAGHGRTPFLHVTATAHSTEADFHTVPPNWYRVEEVCLRQNLQAMSTIFGSIISGFLQRFKSRIPSKTRENASKADTLGRGEVQGLANASVQSSIEMYNKYPCRTICLTRLQFTSG